MRVSAFIRDAALTAAVEALGTGPEQIQPDPHTVAATVALRREIRRLGSNLNQAVALAHRGGNPRSAGRRRGAARRSREGARAMIAKPARDLPVAATAGPILGLRPTTTRTARARPSG